MFAKIEILGILEVVSGLHIGASDAFSAIGSIDSPVLKDPRTGNPLIPGSSLKGKMRSLLAKYYNKNVAKTADEDDPILTALFGCAKKDSNKAVHASKVLFSDMIMSNWEELKKAGLRTKTEVKFENTINRITAVANPRQIERVVRGAEFPLSIIYEVTDIKLMEEDLKILKNGFALLESDYLGGSGSRGYGKIKFNNINVKLLFGNLTLQDIDNCNSIFNDR